MRRLILGAALALLTACGQTGASTAPADPPATQAPNYDTRIGPSGAAGITTAIPFTVEAARAAAPNYIVADGEGMIEGDSFPIITLSAGDEIVFTLMPAAGATRVQTIETISSQARSPQNEIVGTSHFADAPAAEVMYCTTDVLLVRDNGFTCSTAQNGRFWRTYRFAPGYEGPREPFTSIPADAATAATLIRLAWMAPRPAP